MNPYVRARIRTLVADHPGLTSRQLADFVGGTVGAQLQTDDALTSLKFRSLVRKDDAGRWWAT